MSILLVAGGFGNGQTDAAWLYDTVADTWTATTTVPFVGYMTGATLDVPFVFSWDNSDSAARLDSAVWTAINGPTGDVNACAAGSTLIYVVNVNVAPGFYSYDPVGDTVTALADPPPGIAELALAGLVVDEATDSVWSFGGSASPTDNPVFRYDISGDTWSTSTDEPFVAKRSFGACGRNGRTVIVAGGYSASATLASASLFDLDAETWTAAADMPGVLAECQGAWADGKFYVFGGWDDIDYNPTGYVYDPDLDSWSTLTVDFDSSSAGWPAVMAGPSSPAPAAVPQRGLVTARSFPTRDDFPGAGTAMAISENSASWEEQVSETGAGEVTIQREVAIPEMISFHFADGLGGSTRVWTALVEDYDVARVAASYGKQQTALTLFGHAIVFRDALVYQTNDGFPRQVDMHLDWRHKLYDDAAWDDTPQEVTSVDEAKFVQSPEKPNGWPIVPWPFDMPGGYHTTLSDAEVARMWWLFDQLWDPGSDLNQPGNEAALATAQAEFDALFTAWGPSSTKVIWEAGDGSISTPMTVGDVYFRRGFSVTWEGVYAFFFSTLNQGDAWIDGVEQGSAGLGLGGIGAGAFYVVPVHLSAGTHVLAVHVRLWPAFPGILNLGGFAAALYIPGYPPTLIWETTGDTDWKFLRADEPPGIAVTEATRIVVERAQAEGDIPMITLGFTDSAMTDSETPAVDGDTAVLPCIATRVNADLLTFLREITTYCDWRLDPESWELQMFNRRAMNATASGESFLPGVNVEAMSLRGTKRIVNVVIGQFQDQYLEVENATSVADHGRRPVMFDIGNVDDVNEARRVLQGVLDDYSNRREEISAQVDGPLGYIDYLLGSTAPTVDSTGSVTVRIMAIGVRQSDTGRAQTTPSLKDVFDI